MQGLEREAAGGAPNVILKGLKIRLGPELRAMYPVSTADSGLQLCTRRIMQLEWCLLSWQGSDDST